MKKPNQSSSLLHCSKMWYPSDTDTIATIRTQYGERVAELVEHIQRGVSSTDEDEELKRIVNPKHYRWYAEHGSVDDCKLKSAELIDNMRCWEYIAPDHPSQAKFARWCDEAKTFFGDIVRKAGAHYVDTYSNIIAEYQTMPQFHDYLKSVEV